MIVTKKAISRRTILRGVGATVALPLLDAMIPALTAQVKTAAKPIRRLGVIYHPNGVIYDKWLPKGVGTDFELSPTLAGLQPFRDKLTVVTGLFMDLAEALGDGGGDHSRACGGYLSGVHVKKSDTVVESGISMDQIAARAFERETQLSSLQLQMDDNSIVGSCDVGYSCAYSSTISWLTPTLPLMTENNPRVVFERLFGASDSTDPKVRAARLRQDRSILDAVTDRVRQLQRELGAADNRKVNDYLTSLRDVERRIQLTEQQSAKEVPDVARPAGHSRQLRRACAFALRPAASGVSVRHHARHHLHVRARAESASLSSDRRSRAASPGDASSERSGKNGEVRQDSAVSPEALHRLSGEASKHARRRRIAARQCDDSLRCGDQQQRSP